MTEEKHIQSDIHKTVFVLEMNQRELNANDDEKRKALRKKSLCSLCHFSFDGAKHN